MLHALVLAAEAFPVGDRAENACAEQAIALRLEGAVVDGFRLGHFPMRPAPDLFRGRQADANGIEVSNGICHIERARTKHVPPLSSAVRRRARPSNTVARRWSSQSLANSLDWQAREQRAAGLFSKVQCFQSSIWPAVANDHRLTTNDDLLICCYRHRLLLRDLDQLDIQAERLQFANQHVERLGHARLHRGLAFDDGLEVSIVRA